MFQFAFFSALALGALTFFPAPSARAEKWVLGFKIFEEPAALSAQVVSDLETLYAIRGEGATPRHARFFGTVDGRNYLNWLRQGIREIQYFVPIPGYEGLAAYRSSDGIMFVADGYAKRNRSQAGRIGTLMHENLHGVITVDDHVLCPPGRFESIPDYAYACDANAYSVYGMESTFLRNIARYCTNCTWEFREDADGEGKRAGNRVIGAGQAEKVWREF
jgi:hypothetical protein